MSLLKLSDQIAAGETPEGVSTDRMDRAADNLRIVDSITDRVLSMFS